MPTPLTLTPGDIVTIPHGGERIGRRLARVRSVAPYTIGVEVWNTAARRWRADLVVVPVTDCQPALDTDRRVIAARKAKP